MIQLAAALVLIFVVCTSPSIHAQVQKCKDQNGKLIYSDFACQGSPSSQSVKTSGGSTSDSESVMRGAQRVDADQKSIRSAQDLQSMMLKPPPECKFKPYAYGDMARGKVLALNAKRECIENIFARQNGQPTSKEHYEMWNDLQDRSQTKNASDQKQLDRSMGTMAAPVR